MTRFYMLDILQDRQMFENWSSPSMFHSESRPGFVWINQFACQKWSTCVECCGGIPACWSTAGRRYRSVFYIMISFTASLASFHCLDLLRRQKMDGWWLWMELKFWFREMLQKWGQFVAMSDWFSLRMGFAVCKDVERLEDYIVWIQCLRKCQLYIEFNQHIVRSFVPNRSGLRATFTSCI